MMKKAFAFVLATAILFSLSLPALAFSDPYYTVPLIYQANTMPDLPLPCDFAPDPFTDCHDELIITAWACGIVNGSGNGEFRPLDTLTHAEWAQMLYNTFCADKSTRAYYHYDANGNAVRETSWWVPAVHWLEDAAIYPHYNSTDESLRLEMWESLYDFYQSDDYFGAMKQWANASASYDWCIETAYRLWCSGGKVEFAATDAKDWALTYGAGISDSWRNLSNMGAASGQYFTRTEAVALLIRLGELDLRPLG